MKIYIRFFLMLNLFLTPTLNAQLLDRLILELDGASFSQREIEFHQKSKTVLLNTPSFENEMNDYNWQKICEEFINDIVIYKEALRINTFQLDEDEVKKNIAKLNDFFARNKNIRDKYNHPKLNQEIENIANMLSTISAFKKNKQLTTTQNSDTKSSSDMWFNLLLEKSTIRWLEQSKKYQPISFQ